MQALTIRMKKTSLIRLKAATKLGALIGLLFVFMFSAGCQAKQIMISTQDEFAQAVKSAGPGDELVLKNGVWANFEMEFIGKGTERQPIILRAETKGQVILAGQSNLRLSGEHLLVTGLVFKDGYTPTNAVIEYRTDKDSVANHSRVTEVVIDNFNNPERYEDDKWVLLYGRNNRFDHNHLVGKRNKGVTLAVRLNTESSQNNHHRIDHNYFGPRPILGGNGGETLRIGTSHYSLTDSFTVVEKNYFDRCDGELEIISNKSGKNIIRDNVFYESRGTLTLRHGNDNVISGNVFFGNGKHHTGGIRVINKRQTVTNNYLEGLTGYRLGGGFVIMNGVPNSPINRYHQVEDSVVRNNSMINVSHIQFAAGSDEERSAVPIRSEFTNNLIFSDGEKDVFSVFDDISGITFKGNVSTPFATQSIDSGVEYTKFELVRNSKGLLMPVAGTVAVGVDAGLTPISKDEVGVSWYEKAPSSAKFSGGNSHTVGSVAELLESVRESNDGDLIVLNPGTYIVSRTFAIDKALTFKGASPENTILKFEKGTLFELQPQGSLKLESLTISGSESSDSAGNSVIRTVRRSMLTNYDLILDDVTVRDLDVNHSFNFLTVSKGTFADRISIQDSTFENITGHILPLNVESDDFGLYNAEYVVIEGTSFKDIRGAVVDQYRGGTDESTFGPHLSLVESSFENVGNGKRNRTRSAVKLHGVQVADIEANRMLGSAGLIINHTVGQPKTKIVNNTFEDSGRFEVAELNSSEKDTAYIKNNTISVGEK